MIVGRMIPRTNSNHVTYMSPVPFVVSFRTKLETRFITQPLTVSFPRSPFPWGYTFPYLRTVTDLVYCILLTLPVTLIFRSSSDLTSPGPTIPRPTPEIVFHHPLILSRTSSSSYTKVDTTFPDRRTLIPFGFPFFI